MTGCHKIDFASSEDVQDDPVPGRDRPAIEELARREEPLDLDIR